MTTMIRKLVQASAAIALFISLTTPALAQDTAPPLDPRRPTPGPEMANLLDPIKNVLSGPAWLMARGIDNRVWLDRPGWNALTRQDLSQATSPLASDPSPVTQAIGPGVLVPFRSPAPAFSRDLLITRDFSPLTLQTEPDIAVDPNDPDHLVVGAIDFNFPNNSAYVSIDGGVTWEGPQQIEFLKDDRVSGGDPVVAFDSQGNVHFASISIGVEEFTIGPAVGFAELSSIQLTSSNDGGFTWNTPVSTARSRVDTSDVQTDLTGRLRGDVRISFLDKPWMAIGPHPVIEDQDVIYVTYTDFDLIYRILYIGDLPTLGLPNVETTPRLVRSEDGGVTWSEPVAVGPTVQRVYGEVGEPAPGPATGVKRTVQGTAPVVAPDGALYVFWLDSTDDESMKGIAELYMARSDDGGVSFDKPKRIATMLEPGFRPRNAYFRYWSSAFPKPAAGPNGELYVVYTALPPDKPGDDGDIYFIRSLDQGEHWSRPKRLNADDTNRVQFFPAVDVSPSGTIHVMWGDMRDDPVETRYHIYYTRSEDQGQTWGFQDPKLDLREPDTRVTDFPSNPSKGFPSGLFLGDYFGIAATDEDVYMVWADTRLAEFGGTNQKIGFSRRRPIPSPEIFISPPAGSGGETISIQGHNFQPDMNVFLQMGGNTIAAGRTDSQGRITTQVSIPISGEGAHEVQLVDESGNLASTSFFMEFGFDNIRQLVETQQDTQDRLSAIDQKVAEIPQQIEPAVPPAIETTVNETRKQVDTLSSDLQDVKTALAEQQKAITDLTVELQQRPPIPWAAAGLIGLLLGLVAAFAWSAYRQRSEG